MRCSHPRCLRGADPAKRPAGQADPAARAYAKYTGQETAGDYTIRVLYQQSGNRESPMSRMVHRAGHGSWVFVVLFMCLLSGWSTAQVADQQLSPQVDEVFSDFQKPGSPGCALGVFRNGQVIYAKVYGLASVELNAPISPRTVFDIGSTSKQFTAASTLLLEQQGKLSLS